MKSKMNQAAVSLALIASVAAQGTDPSYDHQTATYNSQFQPAVAYDSIGLGAYFSPDHSIDSIVDLIMGVSIGGTIDIATPGFSSWDDCTYFDHGCVGCSISKMQNESFPVFPALLNAIHQRQATVRLVTNNYNTPTCSDEIAPLDWLAMNGVQIRWYTSTTFMHAKFMIIDGKVVSISSINYSYTSMMKNREAGIILRDESSKLIKMVQATFDFDFNNGIQYKVANWYSDNDYAVITSSAPYNLNVPAGPQIAGAYVTAPPAEQKATANVTVFASPDWSRATLFSFLHSAQVSLEVFMYQITDTDLCNIVESAYKNGINVTLLVSEDIYSTGDKQLAAQCYVQLNAAGLTPRLTPSYYKYSHQKYWIVDGKKYVPNRLECLMGMGLSTGNWSPTDYPDAYTFPPYGDANWLKVNRDYNILVENHPIIDVFRTTLAEDFARGSDWTPNW